MDPERLIADGKLRTARKAISEMVRRNFEGLWTLYHRLVEEGHELLAGFIAYCSGCKRLVNLLDKVDAYTRSRARQAFILVGNGEIQQARDLLASA